MTRETKPNARRDQSSEPMMRARSRWPGHWLTGSRWSTGRDRWLEWARALSERHGRVAEQYDLLVLVLARQLPLTQLRWLVSSRWFQPQVKLAIQPILRQTVRREQLRVLPVPAQAERLVETPSGAQPLAPWPAAGSAVLLRFDSVLEKWSRERAAENSQAGDSPRVGSAWETLTRIPLQSVFRRIAEAGEFRRESRHATAIETETHTLLKRIARQAQRVEAVAAGPATLVTRQPAAAVPVTVEQAAAGFQASPVVHTAPWAPSATQMAPINIEQITDHVMRQLDRRVIAARERMGRV